MYYIGIDVSTSCTGLCILNDEREIIDSTYIRLDNKGTMVQKGMHLKDVLIDRLAQVGITSDLEDGKDYVVYIEEPAMLFGRGRSRARTIAVLNMFNGMVQFMVKDALGAEPKLIMPNSARAKVGFKTISEKKCGKSVKEQLREQFEEATGIKFPNKKLKSGPRKGMMVFNELYYDVIDAWVVAESARRIHMNLG